MPVSQEYVDYVLEQLECIGEVTTKNMFGGVGLYFEKTFFAIIIDDILYFKVDDFTRDDYEFLGMDQLRKPGSKSKYMPYFELPIEILEDENDLREWAEKSIAAARGEN